MKINSTKKKKRNKSKNKRELLRIKSKQINKINHKKHKKYKFGGLFIE